MIWALAILFTLFVTDVRSEQECSFKDTEAGYKASWVYDTQNKRVQFAIETKPRSPDNFWTGIGFGQGMRGGDMIIITNVGGRMSATDRHGVNYTEPLIDAQQDAQNFVGRIENGILRATFSRLINTNDRDDNVLEDPALNNCQYFIFPTKGGSTNPTGGIEKHVARPVVKLICNISKCTTSSEVPNPTTPGAKPLSSNNVQTEEVARDAVIANRNQTVRPGQAGAPAGSAVGAGAAPQPQPAASGAVPSQSAPVNPQPGQAGPAAGVAAGSEGVNPAAKAPQAAAGGAAPAGGSDSAPVCEYVEGKYKIQWFYTEVTKRLTFTLDAPLLPSRWTGIGFGQLMQNSDMIIIQDNNGVKASDRHASGHEEPVLDAHQDIESFKGAVNGGVLHATFNRLLNTNDNEDLPIDDEKQNNCQYFMFPVVGGSVDEQGKIQVHESTPKVKLICNAKSCKKPADATAGVAAAGAGADGAAGAGAGADGAGTSPAAGSEPGAAGTAEAGAPVSAGPAGGAGTAKSGLEAVAGQNQPSAAGTSAAENSRAGGVTQSAGAGQGVGQQAAGGQQSVIQGAAGQPGQSAGGAQSAGQTNGGGAGAGQAPTAKAGEAGNAGGASSNLPTQPGAEAGVEAVAPGSAAGVRAGTRRCPGRRDHHLCPQYVDDYLSVVYSRFPKTDVITNKACGLLATNQEGVVLRECCHYLSSQCGRFLDPFVGGLGSGEIAASVAAAPASGAAPAAAAAIPVVAATTAPPTAAAGNGAAGIAGRGGPTGAVPTPSNEPDNSAAANAANVANAAAAPQPSTPNPQVVPGAGPQVVSSAAQNPSANQNPSAGQNPNLAPVPTHAPSASAADRGPEVQPAAPSAHSVNPQPAAGSVAVPNSREAKSGVPPSAGAARRPLPNDPSQPDAAGKPGAKP